MPDFLLDSDICIYLLKDLSVPLSRRIREQAEGTLAISAVTLAEIGLGVRTRPAQADALELFLGDVFVVPFDAAAARQYASLPFRRGRLDRLIAAHALALGVTLVTNNEADFADIPDLPIENWTQ